MIHEPHGTNSGYRFECDDCHAMTRAYTRYCSAWRGALRLGWELTDQQIGEAEWISRDYCPTCWEKLQAIAQAECRAGT